jgi:hypothetical protein
MQFLWDDRGLIYFYFLLCTNRGGVDWVGQIRRVLPTPTNGGGPVTPRAKQVLFFIFLKNFILFLFLFFIFFFIDLALGDPQGPNNFFFRSGPQGP